MTVSALLEILTALPPRYRDAKMRLAIHDESAPLLVVLIPPPGLHGVPDEPVQLVGVPVYVGPGYTMGVPSESRV